MEITEPVVALLHEHAIQRAHTTDTVRTHAEILIDWFDTMEQSSIACDDAKGADLVTYRNRMLTQFEPSHGGSLCDPNDEAPCARGPALL
jgi:integrase/recombinase XerD